MAHGYPDYGVGAPYKTIYPVLDLGELAARLGSIITFDRRGNVIWFDDFEQGINKWKKNFTGFAGTITSTQERARTGGFSAKITPYPDSDSRTRMEHYMPLPIIGRLGFEFSFTWVYDVGEIVLNASLYGHDYHHSSQIRYLGGGYRRWYYLDENSNWQEIGRVILHAEDYLFNTIKLVVDYKTLKYVRLIVNETEFNLSGIPYRLLSPAATYFLMHYIESRPHTNVEVSSYIDDVILTQNEP